MKKRILRYILTPYKKWREYRDRKRAPSHIKCGRAGMTMFVKLPQKE